MGSLKEYLKRTGTISDTEFWINKIKSHAIVKYATVGESPGSLLLFDHDFHHSLFFLDEAEESLLAIDGVKWPQGGGALVSFAETCLKSHLL